MVLAIGSIPALGGVNYILFYIWYWVVKGGGFSGK